MAEQPSLETLYYKVDELRECLKAIDAKLDTSLKAIDAKLDTSLELTTRHDEQIKTTQRIGGSVIGALLAVVGGLVKDALQP